MYGTQSNNYYVTIYSVYNKNLYTKVKLTDYVPGTDYLNESRDTSPNTSVTGILTNLSISGDMTKTALSLIDYFRSQGFTAQSAAGIVGNSYQESKLNPKCEGTVKGVGKTLGLFQFEPGAGHAREDFINWAGSANMYNAEKQCEYMLSKLEYNFSQYTGRVYTYKNGTVTWWPDKMTVEQFKKLTDQELAAEIFCRVYERPSKPEMDTRKSAATKFYNEWSSQNK